MIHTYIYYYMVLGFLVASYNPRELYNYTDPDVLPAVPPSTNITAAAERHLLVS